MMMRSHKAGKYGHSLLAVYCGKKKIQESGGVEVSTSKAFKSSPSSNHEKSINLNKNAETVEGEVAQTSEESHVTLRASTDLVTDGFLEVHVLENPNKAEFKQTFEALEPDIVYFLADCLSGTDDIGPFDLADGHISTSEDVVQLFGERLPQLVCLEVNAAGKFGDALHSKGVPYVIYWKGPLTVLWANHFRQALFAVLRSPSSQIWNACQFAIASFRFYRGIWKSQSSALGPSKNVNPVLLGDAPEGILESPKINESVEVDGSPSTLSKVQIYDEETDFPLLVLAEIHGQDNNIFGALEDGLNALLMVEVIGMRLLHRVSASSPLSNISAPARGVVTMRCDVCTSASARISLLVAGSAHICLDDQMLEYSIKKELMDKSKFVSSLTRNGKNAVGDVRKSASIACGESVTEVRFRSSTWALQVLRQLAPELSFRTLVALGVAGIQGFPVASFQRKDADRFLTLLPRRMDLGRKDISNYASNIPSWLAPPVPSRKRQRIDSYGSFYSKSSGDEDSESSDIGTRIPTCNYMAAMKPIPHVHANQEMPYSGAAIAAAHNMLNMKATFPNGPNGRISRPNSSIGTILSPNSSISVSNRAPSIRAPSPAQMLSLNPVPMKKHGCNRRHLLECSEEEFKKDVMQFLISRGHGRLAASTDVETFPDAVLNGKRLDLYNLYKEVVSRGGFHVGNGINWRGQVFSKMRNHTILNKMTRCRLFQRVSEDMFPCDELGGHHKGVGNTLKKHYETYLLEYEFAHDDVDGECCIICHSSAAGDWVNCGICGEWAHYGCDKRNVLGAFKEYAKTDGLEYICPKCSTSNGGRTASGKKKLKTPANGYCRLSESTLKTIRA